MNTIKIHENGIYMEWGITGLNRLVLLYMGTAPFEPEAYAGLDTTEFSPVEVFCLRLEQP